MGARVHRLKLEIEPAENGFNFQGVKRIKRIQSVFIKAGHGWPMPK